MAEEFPSEKEIDELKMPEANRMCRYHKIHVGEIEELDELTWLIKYHLKCRDRRRSEAVSFFDSNGDHDRERKKILVTLYDDTIEYTKQCVSQDDLFAVELNKLFPSMCKALEQEKQKINSGTSPVLILGETGSGKSSFINLLLGEDILPTSLLSNTHTICELRYCGDGNKSSAKLHKAGRDISQLVEVNEEGDRTSFAKELGEHLQKLDEYEKAVYKLAEIYLPCAILKSGLVIVDSPGIGESEEMDQMVINYILNACAFIYIIDINNAGGIQMRVKDLVQKVYKKALDEQKLYRPESAIFICNKWDLVPMRDRDEVWEDTKKKVKETWPDCNESQIIRFCTREALFIQAKGAVSLAFETVLQKIKALLPVGQEIQLFKGYMYLEQFLSRCVYYLGANLAQIDMSEEEKTTRRKEASDRLHLVQSNLKGFFDKQTQIIEAEVKVIGDQLKEFISEKLNIETICKFDDSEISLKATWVEFDAEIRSTVYKRLRMVIKKWEFGETRSGGGIAKQIQQNLENDFPGFSQEINDIENTMSQSESTFDLALEGDDVSFVPGSVKRFFSKLNTGIKIALSIGLSPFLLIGAIGRIPVFGALVLDKKMTKSNFESRFLNARKNKDKMKTVCETYARENVYTIAEHVKLNLREIVYEDLNPLVNYLKQLQRRMDGQIQSDLDIVKVMQNDKRKNEEIGKMYEPMNAEYQVLQNRLELYLLTYLPGFLTKKVLLPAAIEVTDKTICSGISASICSAKSRNPTLTENNRDFCVRFAKEQVTADNSNRFRNVQIAYTTIQQKNIAICYGLWNQEIGSARDTIISNRLCQVLEPLRCSLRDYLATDDFKANHDSICVRTMSEIVSALDFLHKKKLVHYDLSMDTVAVDFHGSVKLTNISTEMRVNVQPELTDGKICLSNYIHLSSKFFLNKNNVIYRGLDDMYSVGIMMWELWTGQGVVERGKLYALDYGLKEEKDMLGLWKSNEAPSATVVILDQKAESSYDSENAKVSMTQTRSSFTRKVVGEHPRRAVEKEQPPFDQITVDSDEARGSDEVAHDPEIIWNLMDSFRPKYAATQFEFNDNEKKHALGKLWWNTVQHCLDEKLRAEDWLEKFKALSYLQHVS